jgi:hypothetical protein
MIACPNRRIEYSRRYHVENRIVRKQWTEQGHIVYRVMLDEIQKDGAEVWGRILLASLASISTIGYHYSTLSLIVLDVLC